MPEGPEVRRAADRIGAVLAGQRLAEVFFDPDAFPDLARNAKELTGQRVLRIDTHGKAMLTRLGGGRTIYSHNQLYGRWRVCARGEFPDTKRTLRLALHTTRHSALLFSASDIELLDVDGLRRHRYLSRLGPDILDAALDWKTLRDRSQSLEFRRRSIAALYVDQHYLAGSGDYLRSEILFAARIHPWRRPCELPTAALSRLGRQTLTIARRSYRTDGVTNPPKLAARLRAQVVSAETSGDTNGTGAGAPAAPRKTGNEAWRFAVFRREGDPCYACGTPIERARISSRALYYCPQCQSG